MMFAFVLRNSDRKKRGSWPSSKKWRRLRRTLESSLRELPNARWRPPMIWKSSKKCETKFKNWRSNSWKRIGNLIVYLKIRTKMYRSSFRSKHLTNPKKTKRVQKLIIAKTGLNQTKSNKTKWQHLKFPLLIRWPNKAWLKKTKNKAKIRVAPRCRWASSRRPMMM